MEESSTNYVGTIGERRMTDEENVKASYPTAFLDANVDTINIFGRLMYRIMVIVTAKDSKPMLCCVAAGTTKEAAWSCAWRDVQREMLRKLES